MQLLSNIYVVRDLDEDIMPALTDAILDRLVEHAEEEKRAYNVWLQNNPRAKSMSREGLSEKDLFEAFINHRNGKVVAARMKGKKIPRRRLFTYPEMDVILNLEDKDYDRLESVVREEFSEDDLETEAIGEGVRVEILSFSIRVEKELENICSGK